MIFLVPFFLSLVKTNVSETQRSTFRFLIRFDFVPSFRFATRKSTQEWIRNERLQISTRKTINFCNGKMREKKVYSLMLWLCVMFCENETEIETSTSRQNDEEDRRISANVSKNCIKQRYWYCGPKLYKHNSIQTMNNK